MGLAFSNFSYQERILKNRTKNLSTAFEEIEKAGALLEGLKQMAVRSAQEGKDIDITQAACLSHDLREAHNNALAALIQSTSEFAEG